MIEVVGVKFKKVGKIYYFDPKGLNIEKNVKVIVETVRGLEIGEVVLENRMVEENEKFIPLSPVIRIATPADLKEDENNTLKEKAAFAICEEKIKKHGLIMNLIDVEYTFDNNKIIFCFVADGRIDFRELVKDLASVFKTRIELRQIGVRDETKAVGGMGICGRKVCCASFLREFVPVSVKMAKDQSLSTNPQKISGSCGKLICCLNFEETAYEDAYKSMPKTGYVVETPDGQGTVVDSNVLKEYVRVRLDKDPEAIPKTFEKNQIKIIKEVTVNDTENVLNTDDSDDISNLE
jgi:cell fate regulator YaaT (PSP1 superfamily)